MARLLYLQGSPRTQRSKSKAIADAFIDAYMVDHPGSETQRVDLFEMDLPALDNLALQAKYNLLHGQPSSAAEQSAWKGVERVIEQFVSVDLYVLSVPMWNFGIPYRWKQYFDVIVQPGYTFSYSPEEGYRGLVTGKAAVVCYARGGDYSLSEMGGLDHQKPYMETILGFMGFEDIHSVVAQPTLMGGPEATEQVMQGAIERARELAKTV